MKRRFVKWVVIALCAYPILGGLAYVIMLNTDAYRISTRYARTNATVIQRIGDVQSVRLAPYNFALTFRNNLDYARMDLWLRGTRGVGTLLIELRSDSGPWQVTSAKLSPNQGEPVTLTESP
jgi:hypothetical protein